jgi:HK97 gp10 family phage protein
VYDGRDVKEAAMPGTVKFTLTGVAELDRALKELGPRVATNVSGRALRAMAKPIVQRARELVPVGETGRLKESITTKLHRVRPGQRTIDIGFKRPTSRRAHLTEYGTAHSPARPFLRPALDEKGPDALAEMGRVLGEGIEREAIRRGPPSSTDAGESEGGV